jgi:hypothetical protein
MAVTSSDALRAAFIGAYGGYADGRLRGDAHDAPFIVDDRQAGDRDARRQLFNWFCILLVRVQAHDRIQLTLGGELPRSPEVDAWLPAHGAQATGLGFHVTLSPQTVADLEDLADHIAAVVRRRYDTPAYKYVAPRTARALRRLAGVLNDAWA